MKTGKITNANGVLLAISGFSASGKDTIMENLLSGNFGFERIVTYTSRSPRVGEVHGRDYYFVSKEKFKEMIEKDEFFEYVNYAGDYKGTHKNSIMQVLEGKRLIWRIDLSRAATIKETINKKLAKHHAKMLLPKTLVIVVAVSKTQTLLKRAREREKEKFNEKNFRQRLQADLKIFKSYTFDHVIYNDGEIKESFSKVLRIVRSKKLL